jgi:hypothetical protein
MTAVASIVLNDAQATPVSHTFVPLGPDKNGVWWFEDQSASSAIGYGRISLFLSRAAIATAGQNSGQRMNRVQIGIWTPKLETLGTSDNGLTPPDTVAYVPRVNVDFTFPDRALAQDRDDLRVYVGSIVGNSMVHNMITNLLNIY